MLDTFCNTDNCVCMLADIHRRRIAEYSILYLQTNCATDRTHTDGLTGSFAFCLRLVLIVKCHLNNANLAFLLLLL